MTHTHTKKEPTHTDYIQHTQHTRRGRDVLYPFGYGLSYTMLGCRGGKASGLCAPLQNQLAEKRCNASLVLQYCAGRLNP